MNILLVTSSLDNGGAEKWMVDTVHYMNRKDLSIDYYFWNDIKNNNFLNEYKSLGVNVYFGKLNVGKNIFKLGKEFKSFVKKHGPYDAVHINGTKLIYQMIIIKISKIMNIPVRIVHSHSAESQNLRGIKKTFRKIIRRTIINNATIIGGCSELAVKAKYGSAIIKNSKYHILKNGINYTKFNFSNETRKITRDELNIGNEPVFLHIGRFSREKNHKFILEIFDEILKINKDSKLILIGQGPLEKDIFNYEKKLKIEKNIIHIPFTNQTEKYYSVADMLIFPSFFEGLPIVLLEAQASGLPCVISNTISDEILINDNIKMISLEENSKIWAQTAMNMSKTRCDNGQNNIYNAGYDISQTSNDFLRCCKNGK